MKTSRIKRVATLLSAIHKQAVETVTEYNRVLFVLNGDLIALLKYDSDTSDRSTLLVK